MNGAEFLSVMSEIVGSETAHRYALKFRPLDAEFMNGLLNYEALAFYVYSTAVQWHADINEQLWSQQPSEAVRCFALVLDCGLAKLNCLTGSQATVYRGYRCTDLALFAADYPVRATVVFHGFTSVAYHQNSAFGGNVLFIIRSLSARSIWFLAADYHEHEALLPTGCRFEVVENALRGSRLVIVLQEVRHGS